MEPLRKAVDKAGGVGPVAELAGVSESHLYGLCNGNKTLTAATMRKLLPHVRLSKATWFALLKEGTTDAA